MDRLYSLTTNNLDIIYFIYGLAFLIMGIAILVQPKKHSVRDVAGILWILGMFAITHGANELLDMWSVIKGRHHIVDIVRWIILFISYCFLFEFGRRFLRLRMSVIPHWQRRIAGLFVWWTLPVIGIIIFAVGYASDDFWKVGSIWTRYLLGLPGGLLIGTGFILDFKYERDILEPLKVKKYFMCSGAAFLIYGILGGTVVPRGDFFPANWLNTDTFMSAVRMPVQVFRAACALAAAWSISGILRIFSWEMKDKLQERTERLRSINEILEIEIAERIVVEKALAESHERLLLVLDSLDSSVYVADMKTYDVLFANKHALKTCGDIIGSTCWKVIHADQTGPCDFCTNDKLITPEGDPAEVCQWEFYSKAKQKYYYIQDRAICWEDGHVVKLQISTDITESKLSENKTKESLKEKEVLLKEIHHRVKNNMQVISSLLNLQSQQMKDEKYQEMLNESRNRIAAMALVHEKLYLSDNLADIDFNDYIVSLANGLASFYKTNTDVISIKKDISPACLSIDTAIPCGIIVNELISNALKHAFPEGKTGEIWIKFKKTGSPGADDDGYELIVSDNGVGMPEGIDFRSSESLGMKLITNLAEHQLQGSLNVDGTNGTEVYIRFREPKYMKRI